MNIEWKTKAQIDASSLLAYIAQDNINVAYRVYDDIHRQVKILADYPSMGRNGRLKGTRELIITDTPYIVVYKISGDNILILRIIRSAQNWKSK